jgi:hypothetical protein
MSRNLGVFALALVLTAGLGNASAHAQVVGGVMLVNNIDMS